MTGSNSTSYGDVFQFGKNDGKDVITNYGTNDTLNLTGTRNLNSINYYTVGSDRVVSLSSAGVVTLKGAASKDITVRLSNGSTTVIDAWDYNYYRYSYFEERGMEERNSGNVEEVTTSDNYVTEHWFTEDDNFVTSDFDSIMQNNISDISMNDEFKTQIGSEQSEGSVGQYICNSVENFMLLNQRKSFNTK